MRITITKSIDVYHFHKLFTREPYQQGNKFLTEDILL